MDFLSQIDGGHILGSGGVATAVWLVATRVLKPLLEKFLTDMPAAIRENTETVKSLVESNKRAAEYQHAEHKEMTALLHVLSNSLLKLNGEHDVELPTKTVEPSTTPFEQSSATEVSKQEFQALQADVGRILDFLKGE